MTLTAVDPNTSAETPTRSTLFDITHFANSDQITDVDTLVQVLGGVKTDFHVPEDANVQIGDTVQITIAAEVKGHDARVANKDGTIHRETILVKPLNVRAKYLGQNGPAKPVEE